MTTTSHIATSGGLISTAFIENIRQAQTHQRGTQPDTYGLPWRDAPTLRQAQDKKSPAVLEATIAETWETLLERWDAIATELHTLDISQARDRWILPLLRALDFQPVYQRSDIVLDDSEALRFNVSHFGWGETSDERGTETNDERGAMDDEQKTHRSSLIIHRSAAPPLHTVAPNIDLDARQETTTARRAAKGKSPHDMLQLFLNVSRPHRWGLLTNGLHLRLLRDYHHTYSKGYVEFDLESIFETRNFADFRALYRMTHASRFIGEAAPLADDAAEPVESWDSVPLEMFYRDSQAAGIQVGADLQKQVREAIETLGNGFLLSGGPLLAQLQTDTALCQQFYAELLHIVYRVLFLLYAEQRGMAPQSGAPLDTLYRQSYSLTALRAKAENDPASPEAYDLWEGLKVTFKMFRLGAPELGVYRYNGMLFAEDQTPLLDGGGAGAHGSGGEKDSPLPPGTLAPQPAGDDSQSALRCRNFELLRAIRALTLIEREGALQRISYADLNVEEIGGIYESLLDFAPRVTTAAETVEGRDLPPNTFFLDPRGTARKTSGSYYTHPSLVNALIESALLPVLEERLAKAREMGSGEWGVGNEDRNVTLFNEEKNDATAKDTIVSGSGRMADGDDSGRELLSADPKLSEGGALRNDLSDSASGGFDTGQHRRGERPGESGGVHPVSADRSRLTQGIGDPSPALRTGSSDLEGSDTAASEPVRARGQNAARTDSGSSAEAIAKEGSGELGIGNGDKALTPHSPLPTPEEAAILSLKVCDPAMGSGHFLIAANNALALRLAQIRTGDDFPAERHLRQAKRDVLAHCIYGVDLNPMAVELGKVALWINAAVDNAPLSFLDHHLKCGNSLIGATPELLEQGIPDDAFQPVTGDDPKVASAVRKRNKQERSGQLSLWRMTMLESEADLQKWRELNDLAEDEPRLAERRYAEYRADPTYRNAKLIADLWTAAFFWPLAEDSDLIPTEELFRQAQADPQLVPSRIKEQAAQLAERHNFFHWHQEFPDVFSENGAGGFDVVLGNPPWEKMRIEKREFFSQRDQNIAAARTAAQRDKMIGQLGKTDPELLKEYNFALRASDFVSKYLRNSGRYRLTAKGDINSFAIFAELDRMQVSNFGRAGIIVPSGIVTDFTYQDFFQSLMYERNLVSLFDFQNSDGLFPGVDRNQKFALLTASRSRTQSQGAEFVFGARSVDDLIDPDRKFELTVQDIEIINPNTLTCPIFRTKQDATIAKKIYTNCPVLISENQQAKNSWQANLSSMFHMGNDSNLFVDASFDFSAEASGNRLHIDGNAYLPLFEAKMFHQFDHRFAKTISREDPGKKRGLSENTSLEEYHSPNYFVTPRFWVNDLEITDRVGHRYWFLACRRITGAVANIRTGVFAITPRAGFGDSATLIELQVDNEALHSSAFLANTNSFVLDFATRQKLSGMNLSFFIMKQLPVIPPDRYTPDLLAFIVPRVLELTYTAWDLRAFADDVWGEAGQGSKGAGEQGGEISNLQQAILKQWQANRDATGGGHEGAVPPVWAEAQGSKGAGEQKPHPRPAAPLLPRFPHPPFKWDDARRAQLRADLDGLYGHLYGLTRDELAYILDTFPIVRRKDEAQYGEYRTKRMVLEAYDELQG